MSIYTLMEKHRLQDEVAASLSGEEVFRMARALKTAAHRFSEEEFGCVWQDAADECTRAIPELIRELLKKERGE